MEDRVQAAVSTFREGFNCAQAVFSAYSDRFGLERQTALKLSNGFGAGMGRNQEVCGALSGAVMLIGLKYGKVVPDDKQAQEKTYAEVRKLFEEFSKANGSILCKEILGCNISTPDGMQYALDKNLFRTTCVKCVQDAATLVGRVLSSDGD